MISLHIVFSASINYRPSRSTSLSESSSKRRRLSKTTPLESEIIELAAPCGRGVAVRSVARRQRCKAGGAVRRAHGWAEWARLPSSPHRLQPYARETAPLCIGGCSSCWRAWSVPSMSRFISSSVIEPLLTRFPASEKGVSSPLVPLFAIVNSLALTSSACTAGREGGAPEPATLLTCRAS